MSKSKTFSVVIPVYNRANLIRSTINSVLNQSFQDFEVLIIDDGSTDDLENAVKPYLGDRIDLIRQPNGGGGRARNTGIDHAGGRYIAFLDSDDTFLPHHLATMLDIVEKSDRIVGYSQVVVERGGGKRALKPPRPLRLGESMAEYLCCSRGFVQTSTLVVPTELAQKVRFREGMKFGQDTDFAIRLSLEPCEFRMASKPGVIWNDAFDPSRVSALRKGASNMPWIEEMRPCIPSRAYYGYMGWHVAKGVAKSSKFDALKLYASAVARGCYSAKLATVIFMQIFFRDDYYRKLADNFITLRRRLGKPIGTF